MFWNGGVSRDTPYWRVFQAAAKNGNAIKQATVGSMGAESALTALLPYSPTAFLYQPFSPLDDFGSSLAEGTVEGSHIGIVAGT